MMKPLNAVVAAGMADAEPGGLLRRRRAARRAALVGWQAFLLGLALGGIACLVLLASVL